MKDEVDYSKDASPEKVEITPEEPMKEGVESSKESEDTSPKEETISEDSGSKDSETDYKKMFLDTQKAFTKGQMELAELKGKLSVLQDSEKKQEIQDWLDQYNDEQILDPNAIRTIVKNLRLEVNEALKNRDEYFENVLKKQHPGIMALRSEIDQLRFDPDYGSFTDEQLAIVINKAKVTGEEKKKSHGVPGGKSISISKEIDIKETPLFKRIYGDKFKEKK